MGCKNLVVTIDGVSYIGDGLKSKVWLVDCNESVVSVNVPDNVIGFADYAFQDCSALTTIYLPSDLLRISTGAFYNCTKLSSVGFPAPSQITSIGSYAFSECKSLQGLYMPNSVTQFGDYVFKGCSSLKTIHFAGTTEEWNAIDDFGDKWCVVNVYSHFVNGTLVANSFSTGFEIQCSNGVALPTYNKDNGNLETTKEEENNEHHWTKRKTIFDKD